MMVYILLKQVPLGPFRIDNRESTELEVEDLRNRMISTIHGNTLFVFSMYHYFFMPSECGSLNNTLQRKIIAFSASFFMFDLVAMWYENLLDLAMLFHHCCCMWADFTALYENISGDVALNTFFAAEISNPAMNAKHILRLIGLRYTKA